MQRRRKPRKAHSHLGPTKEQAAKERAAAVADLEQKECTPSPTGMICGLTVGGASGTEKGLREGAKVERPIKHYDHMATVWTRTRTQFLLLTWNVQGLTSYTKCS
ncbi:hypothetical protein NDU88_011339 [Pleurodeles waltl]|uniref:Uncharacterized protein n=1 Tax=Pleurodeles waltl TaxID=8319 RepID=A0AAV7S3Y0_PLEWA|nr:hypothetical protein NDU88_011339 [Pleurodeles waltl]